MAPLAHARILAVIALSTAITAPAASAAFTSKLKKGVLTLEQTANNGQVTIDNNGPNGAFRVLEVGTTTFQVADSLVVVLLDNSDPILNVDFDSKVIRDVSLELGNGQRQVNFVGANNTMGGTLTIMAGAGDQVVELAVSAALDLEGALNAQLGKGFDTVDNDNNAVTVTGDMTFIGVNEFESNGVFLVIGDVHMRTTNENQTSRFDVDAGGTTILGNFEFIGGKGRDEVLLNDGAVIGCNVDIELGDGPMAGGTQFGWINGAEIGGDVTVKAGNSDRDDFNSASGTTFVGGRVKVALGPGPNEADFFGRYGGPSVSYKGGHDVDTVFVAVQGRTTNVDIDLGKGADILNLQAQTSVKRLTVDFGKGVDTYNDSYGDPKPFKTKLKSLP